MCHLTYVSVCVCVIQDTVRILTLAFLNSE